MSFYKYYKLPGFMLSLMISMPSLVLAEEYIYPEDVGVIDVTQEPWNFDNTGTEDITNDFQTLVDQTLPNKFVTGTGQIAIIYFPDGIYRLTDSVIGHILDYGQANGWFLIQGQSRDGVILRLDDNAVGFDNPSTPKRVIDYMSGNSTNNAFGNMLENLTVDVGSGNPGAVGVRFHANNLGAVRNISIVSSDPQGAGAIGLEAVKGTNGPWLIRGLEVQGFDYGLDLGNASSGRHMVSIQDLALKGQRMAGVRLENLVLNILNGTSRSQSPFLLDLTDDSLINMINCTLDSTELMEESALMTGSPTYLRNVSSSGYGGLVSNEFGLILDDLQPGEDWYSHPRNFLWEETSPKSIGLPVEQAPELPWPDASEWYVMPSPNGQDDTEAIRKAFTSGKSMVIFQPGHYRISETISIPTHVSRISGQWARLGAIRELGDGESPLFILKSSEQPVVLIEKFRTGFSKTTPNPFILNASNTTLVIRDLFYVAGAVYRSEPTRGRVFFENCHSLPGTQDNFLSVPAYEIRGQSAWGYQWNPEQLFPHAIVDGGSFFVLGAKTGETRGPIVDARNHAFAEMLGISMNCTHDELDIDPLDTVLLLSEDANISANFLEHAQLTGGGRGWGRHHYVAIETRNGETRRLLNTDPSVAHSGIDPQFGAVVQMYTGYYDQDNPANQAPVVSNLQLSVDQSGYEYSVSATVSDPDNYPALEPKLHWRVVSGPGLGEIKRISDELATVSFSRPGTYQLEISGTDGSLESSRLISLDVAPKRLESRLGLYDAYRYVDNSPLDGEVDVFSFGFLKVGDDVQNNRTDLRLELDISPLQGGLDRISAASLQLQISTLTNLEAISASYGIEQSFGVADAEDFQVARQSMGETSLAGFQPGDWVAVDILPAVQHGLENGHSFLTIWLNSNISQDGAEQSVIFSSTALPDESLHPLFEVKFAPLAIKDGAALIENSLYFHPVFGYFYDFGSWIYHYQLGWVYQDLTGNSGGSFYMYLLDLGWCYTNDTFYPWVYLYETRSWTTF